MPKLTIELNDRTSRRLEELARSKGVSKVNILRWALALYDFAAEQTEAGNRLTIVSPEGEPSKEIIIIGPH